MARVCPQCTTRWPAHGDFARCPRCQRPTDYRPGLDPTFTLAEGRDAAAHFAFERYYDAHKEARRAQGLPDPAEVGRAQGRLDAVKLRRLEEAWGR